MKKSKQLQKTIEIDVQSRFSEGDLEYVTPEDSLQVLQSFDSWYEFINERNEE